jgi:hypothetical protein
MEKESSVVVSWSEPLSALGVTDDMLVEALKRGVRDHLLDSPQLVAQIRAAIARAETLMNEDDLVKALKDDMLTALKSRIAEQRAELQKCLGDYKAFYGMHASEYAQRRYQELHDKLSQMDRG